MNNRLLHLLREADWTGGDLAREVNAIAAESGLHLRYQRASVSQWTAGTRPRPPVADLVAEALTRRLGRTVTPEGAGFAASDPRQAPMPHPRAPLPPGADTRAYRLADLDGQVWFPSPAPDLPPHGPGGGRLTNRQVACVERMAAHFSHADHLTGSGNSLPGLTSFFTDVVRDWLDAPATPAVRRGMLRASGRLAYIGGAHHLDAGRHGAAQHWYRLAATLAHEAGDPRTPAIAARALSVQAHLLGHHRHSLLAAERALDLGARLDRTTAAQLVGQHALALAACGHRDRALAEILRAERWAARSDGHTAPPDDPAGIGVYHPAAFLHQRAEVRARLGDPTGAVADLESSTRLRPPTEPRSRALVLARLAELRLSLGQVDQACATWTAFLGLAAGMASRRLDDAAAALRTALRPHRRHPAAADLITASYEGRAAAAEGRPMR
ncbi:hypothetical protein [Kitasatospora cineracea]|uniref:hypothetical protein n=1 Tax=Kitasatospora cineracea TaxID=88074 RepID=UPI0037B3E9FD